ncbi:hypothetical protein PSE10B_30270 [Pseudomonas amygdali pv. eriobotryae]|nr:hypothetical protein PSE10B_30270 [Pseudomonas amygdali pv. eriobotryae]
MIPEIPTKRATTIDLTDLKGASQAVIKTNPIKTNWPTLPSLKKVDEEKIVVKFFMYSVLNYMY